MRRLTVVTIVALAFCVGFMIRPTSAVPAPAGADGLTIKSLRLSDGAVAKIPPTWRFVAVVGNPGNQYLWFHDADGSVLAMRCVFGPNGNHADPEIIRIEAAH
jgi:hypothetical protein